ncbi:MAG: hypothetical protein HY690_15170 [Chloroflexi bacterium]|nr:hypothetical protein [Chloroflexota bacterium]
MKIAIVGPCASGTSTLAARLRARGYDARALAQEHSYVPDMWRMAQPDALIYLDAGLETVRKRRPVTYGEEVLVEQRRRLEHARRHCTLYVSTDDLTPEEVEARALRVLEVGG